MYMYLYAMLLIERLGQSSKSDVILTVPSELARLWDLHLTCLERSRGKEGGGRGRGPSHGLATLNGVEFWL